MERAPETTSKGISPAIAFAAVAGILVAIGLTWFLVRPEPTKTSSTQPTPADFSLTNEEAIARFQELNQLRVEAYEGTDLSLVDSFLTAASPIREDVISEIDGLKRDGVRPELEIENRKLEVSANADDEIEIRQTIVFDAFFFEDGKDVTEDGGRELQLVVWEMRLQNGAWLIHDAEIEEARALE